MLGLPDVYNFEPSTDSIVVYIPQCRMYNTSLSQIFC